MNLTRLLGTACVVVVAVGLALAFIFLGTPAHQRRIALDARRVDDLVSIANAVHNRFAAGKLPKNLPAVLLGQDPVTKRNYEYRRVDDLDYVLCAVFDTDQSGENGAADAEVSAAWPRGGWRHGAGRTCYEIGVMEDNPIPRRL